MSPGVAGTIPGIEQSQGIAMLPHRSSLRFAFDFTSFAAACSNRRRSSPYNPHDRPGRRRSSLFAQPFRFPE
jgi:hypothetical protein